MKPKLLLRIASILMLLHTIGHTIGSLTWKDSPDPAVAKVVQGMINQHFEFMGRSATIAMFYSGYGFILICVLLFVVALLWVLSNHASNQPLTKQVALLLFLFLLALAIIEYICFFVLPGALSLLAAISTGIALIKINKLNYAL